MKKMIAVLSAAMILSTAALAETAYPTISLNSADYGIGSVYMAKSMITTEAVNPVTVADYTEEEIAALESGESIELDEGMVLALSVNGTDTVFQYDSEEANLILSHSDALVLNGETGEVTDLNGKYVVCGAVGYPGIALNNADYGIGSVYFTAEYFTTEHINPTTVANFTEEEIQAITAENSIAMPIGSVLALSVNESDTLFFYNAEESAKILAHSDALILNAETGEVTTQEGEIVAQAM